MNKIEITFETEIIEDDYYDEGSITLTQITPILKIDGINPVSRDVPFDVIELIVHGTDNSLLDPYTCSCGEPGCAGIHERVELISDEHNVKWVLPKSFYSENLNSILKKFYPVLIFEKKNYELVLDKAIQDIVKLQKESEYPIVISPVSIPSEYYIKKPFTEHIADCKEAYIKHMLWVEEHKNNFGPILNTNLIVKFDAFEAVISGQTLAWYLAEKDGIPTKYMDVINYVKNKLVPDFINNKSEVLNRLKHVTSDELLIHGFFADNTKEYMDNPPLKEDLDLLLPTADFYFKES